MAQFLDNTIYTSYALNKMSENLSGDYSVFHFITVKIGSGDNTLDIDKKDLSTTLYSLKVYPENIVFDKKTGILTIKCEIPPDLADIPITEIGLYDTFLGIQHLFSYSKVMVVKPADLNYELTIVLNLGPRTIDFPGLNIIKINEYEYATQKDLDNFWNMFIFCVTNLERIIHKNGEEIGRNKAQITYKRQEELSEMVRNFAYSNLYLSLQSKYTSNLSDLFFINKPKYFAYNLVNFAHSDSYLRTIEGLFTGVNDTVSFHNGACMLGISASFKDLNTPSTVINKKTPSTYYFSLDIQKGYEQYVVGKAAEYNELVFTFYGLDNSYTLKYIFDMDNQGKYINKAIPYIITFNGNLASPEFNLYVDGKKPEIFITPPSSGENDDIKAPYGKVIRGTVGDMSYAPDYSKEVTLRNYYVDGDIKYYFENAKGINNIIQVKKQPTNNEIAFLSNILSRVN